MGSGARAGGGGARRGGARAELRNCGRMGTSDPRPAWAVLGQAFRVSELVLTQIEAGGIEGRAGGHKVEQGLRG